METKITNEEAKAALHDKEQQATEILKDKNQTYETLSKANGLLDKIKKLPVIGKRAEDIAISIELIRDFVDGRYRRVPASVIVSTLAGILYIISPIDLIPDVIPVAGWIDDALVFTLILNMGLSSELKKYQHWKELQESEPVYDKLWSDEEEGEV